MKGPRRPYGGAEGAWSLVKFHTSVAGPERPSPSSKRNKMDISKIKSLGFKGTTKKVERLHTAQIFIHPLPAKELVFTISI